MTTRIGLISDVHACAAPLEDALSIFRSEKVDMVLNLGDVAGYGTELNSSVELLKKHQCSGILGNHEAWYLEKIPEEQEHSVREYFSGLPVQWESIIDGVKVNAVHASPPDSMTRGIRLLNEKGYILLDEKKHWSRELAKYSFDVLIVGHTHQVFAEQLEEKLVINPGSTKFNHTCAVLNLPEMSVKIFSLSGKEPLKAWNWGMLAREESID